MNDDYIEHLPEPPNDPDPVEVEFSCKCGHHLWISLVPDGDGFSKSDLEDNECPICKRIMWRGEDET